MQRFSLTEIQAQAILDMRLQRLTNLEILTLRKEYAEIEKRIAYLKGILASEKKLMNVIKKELEEIGEKYADARRTKLVDSFDEIVIEEEAPVADEVTVVVTRAGFCAPLRPPRRGKGAGGRGAAARAARRDDRRKAALLYRRGQLLRRGRFPDPRMPPPRPRPAAGRPAGGSGGGRALHLRLCPRQGLGWRDDAAHRGRPHQAHGRCRPQRAQGALRGADAARGRQAAAVLPPTACKDVLVVTRQGMAICFSLAEVSVLGRTAAGVKAIQLAPADRAVACIAHDGEGEALLVTDRGYMKRCPAFGLRPAGARRQGPQGHPPS